MVATQTADTRFLRRILMALVLLTLAAGAVPAYTGIGALSVATVDAR